MSIVIPNRGDQLGSNFIVKVAAFIYGHINSYNIYYEEYENTNALSFKYRDDMYYQPFFKYSEKKDDSIDYVNFHPDNLRIQQATPVVQLKQDLPSYFRKNFKSDFYKIISEIAKEREYILPWKNPSNIICIHIRLSDNSHFDGSTFTDYDGRGSALYIRGLIEQNRLNDYSKKSMSLFMNNYCSENCIRWDANRAPDRQCAISVKELERMILDFKKQYPEKEIHIVTMLSNTNPKHQKYIDISKKYNITIHSNKDYDYDLWLMIHADILVMSKSTFPLIAGYYHQGSKIYYSIWGVLTSCGIWTKYDKSNWIPYV